MSAADGELLRAVFGPGNRITLTDIDQGLTPEARAVSPLIARFRGDAEAAVVLPRIRAGGAVRWYGVARNAAAARLLAEQLLAFIGPTYTDFTGAMAVLDLDDPVESAIAEFVQGAAFCLDVDAGFEVDVCDQVSLLAQVLARQPPRGTATRRTLDAALRDFDVALQVRDADGSEALLDELTALGAHNGIFLRVRRLAALERWRELLDLPHLATVMAARRPQAVTRDLIRAIYAVHLARFEDPSEPAAALREFQENVREPFAPLLTAWGGMRDAAVRKTFMLLAASDADMTFRDALLAATVGGAADPALDALATLVNGRPAPVVGDPLAEARKLIDAFRFDAAWQVLQAAQPDRIVVALMISCAIEFRSVGAAAETLSTLADLDAAERDLLLRSRVIALQIDALREQSGERPSSAREAIPAGHATLGPGDAVAGASTVVPGDVERGAPARLSGWREWLLRVDGGWTRQAALSVARAGATEWPLEGLADDPDALQAFIELLDSGRSSAATATLRMATPSLIEALGLADRAELVPLYLDLALSLRLSEGFSANDMVLVDDLAQRALRAGVDFATYAAIVHDYLDVWRDHGSPHRLDWLLDAIDTLMAVSSAGQDGPEQLFAAAIAWCGQPRHRSRIESHQWAALASLAEDLDRLGDIDALISADERIIDDVPPDAVVGSLTVGVYSLQERAGLGAQKLIESRYPGVSVAVRHDTANSTALEQLAKAADVFIVTWQAATHAATDAISAARPKHRPVVYAAGTGRSSIVRAFEASIMSA